MIATRTASNGEATVAAIEKAGGTAALCVVDIGQLENIERAVAETVERWGGIDIMVHNAASFLGGPVDRYSEDDLETVLSVNLKACFRLSRAVIPTLRERGGGRLLFTSSVTGPRVVMPGTSYYAASKGGMNAFIRTAAIELARDKITVNAIVPGLVATEWRQGWAENMGKKMGKTKQEFLDGACQKMGILTGRWASMEEISDTVVFIASDRASYINGAKIMVDGGYSVNAR